MDEDETNDEDIVPTFVRRENLNAIEEDPSESESESDSNNKSKNSNKMEEEEDDKKDEKDRLTSVSCILFLILLYLDKTTNNLIDIDISSDDYNKLSDTEKTYSLQYPEFIKSYQAVSDDTFDRLSIRYNVLIVFIISYYYLNRKVVKKP